MYVYVHIYTVYLPICVCIVTSDFFFPKETILKGFRHDFSIVTYLILISVSIVTNLVFLESTYIINRTARLQDGVKYTKTIFQVHRKLFIVVLKGYIFQSYLIERRITFKFKEEIWIFWVVLGGQLRTYSMWHKKHPESSTFSSHPKLVHISV